MGNKYITRDFLKQFFQIGDTAKELKKLDWVISRLIMQKFPNNTILRKYGEEADIMYFIESGKALVLEEDNKTVKGELSAGQYFGEYALLTGDKSLATILTRSPVILYSLDKASLFELIRDNPKIFGYFLKQTYVQNTNIYAEKERINAELTVAANIQNDMLPNISSKLKSFEWVNVYAEMEPAKQVGGDFYDFFYLDEEESNLVFVIADVSGKGVPAALFMVISKTLIKTQMMQGFNTAETLERANNLLAQDNSLSMFVTVFICTLNLKTGVLQYANAGHNRPLVLFSNEPYKFLELKKGLPLGLFEGSRYKQCEMQLHPGDRIYLYTDGVNEAMNPEGKELGNDAFLEAANKFRALPPEGFDNAIRNVITEFANGTEQSDDITTMAISYIRQRESGGGFL